MFLHNATYFPTVYPSGMQLQARFSVLTDGGSAAFRLKGIVLFAKAALGGLSILLS